MPVSDHVIFRALDTGGVLVHLDGHQIFELNATATFIWPLLVAGMDRATIAAALVGTFEVETLEAEAAIDRLLADLASHGLFQP